MLEQLDTTFERIYGNKLLREHNSVPHLISECHRFRAVKKNGILELATELTKLFSERVDVSAIFNAIGNAQKGEKLGSLKALERLVAKEHSELDAKSILAPLFGIYDLRLESTHIGSSKTESGLQRVGVDIADPITMQGQQLLRSFVDTLRSIEQSLT